MTTVNLNAIELAVKTLLVADATAHTPEIAGSLHALGVTAIRPFGATKGLARPYVTFQKSRGSENFFAKASKIKEGIDGVQIDVYSDSEDLTGKIMNRVYTLLIGLKTAVKGDPSEGRGLQLEGQWDNTINSPDVSQKLWYRFTMRFYQSEFIR